ncbi:ribonuclease HIII [Streptococcus himalayensis]|uniref:Ribonuclease HIII n=1 Tax=Streptococcus himalayensis TaxID=1888195 RepID=A0A917AA41_9STRE|nr:ribonuclease HIII [Streptococcus himalayensis]GGE36204.1 ribonuclease HIII [Streptococcus himalayensis]
MDSISLTPSETTIQDFVKKYKDQLSPSNNQYIRYFFRLQQATVSIYTSGKVLIQGGRAQEVAKSFGYQASGQKDRDSRQDLPLIGTDEVGNGSYFGGIAVVASFVTPDQHEFLKKLGVGDSKTLTDSKIRQLAPLLKEKIQHQALLLSPKKYNEVIDSGYNAVSVKVALHNQAIYLLLKQGVTPQKIVIDAFTSLKNYQNYLQNERNHFANPISLEEKAEGKYLAVAVSSILARDLFLENLEQLSQEFGYPLPSGAGSKSDQVGKKVLAACGMNGLQQTAKLHFKNTEKIKQLLER